MTTSLLDVQARWGYSEIVDATFSHCYTTVNDIEALRAKRRKGVPFDQLAVAERYALAPDNHWEAVPVGVRHRLHRFES